MSLVFAIVILLINVYLYKSFFFFKKKLVMIYELIWKTMWFEIICLFVNEIAFCQCYNKFDLCIQNVSYVLADPGIWRACGWCMKNRNLSLSAIIYLRLINVQQIISTRTTETVQPGSTFRHYTGQLSGKGRIWWVNDEDAWYLSDG